MIKAEQVKSLMEISVELIFLLPSHLPNLPRFSLLLFESFSPLLRSLCKYNKGGSADIAQVVCGSCIDLPHGENGEFWQT